MPANKHSQLQHTNNDIPAHFQALIDQAKAAQALYQQGAGVAALNDAIAAWEQILNDLDFANAEPIGRLRLKVLNDSASTYWRRYRVTGVLTDLDKALSSWKELVNTVPADFPDLPMYLNNLGIALSDRYQRTGSLSDLKDGIAYAQKAVELTSDGEPNLPSYLNNLGRSLSYRYERTGSLSDLDGSITQSQKAVELTPEGSPDLPMYLNNLGNRLSDRYQCTGSLSDLKDGIAAYKKAAQRGLEVALEQSLNSATNWLFWAFRRQAWAEVVQAYDYAFKASTRLVQTQLTRQHQTLWLKKSQGLAAHAAYAFAKQQQLEHAVVTIERGLAQLLSDALARNLADLEQLKTSGHQNLYDAYQQAINDWHEAQQLAEPSKIIGQRLRTAREQLDTTIAAIRKIDGYADFLAAPEYADIRAAVKDTALIYIMATEAGGLALIVADTITPVWLPELTVDSLKDTRDNQKPAHRGYLRAYDNWRRDTKKDINRTEWFQALEHTTLWLSEHIMAPIIQAVPTTAVTLIPVGRLGLLPLQAAWTNDDNTPTGKRYALDTLTINYAPNARAARAAQQLAAQITPNKLLAIQEPLPVNANELPSASYETETVISTFEQPTVLKNQAATRNAVLHALPNHNVLHFSCHGLANLQQPLQSGLVMANDQFLTIKDVLNLRLHGVRLATLSACETGIPGTELPDEVVNLPAGLLQAGVAGVAASLWSVNDFSTMMLMAYFYDRWRIDEFQPADALRQAQIWMRDTTNAEKQQYFEHLLNELTIPNQTRMAEKTLEALNIQVMLEEPDERQFEHPFYWAAFGFSGV